MTLTYSRAAARMAEEESPYKAWFQFQSKL